MSDSERRAALKARLIKKFSAQSPVYENCRMLSREGEVLCYCDMRRLEWCGTFPAVLCYVVALLKLCCPVLFCCVAFRSWSDARRRCALPYYCIVLPADVAL
jgi:hypothetical protein